MRWQNWSFVIGFNAREGLTLHHLRYDDDGRERSILYRASLTEMVVPYGDPGPTQRRKNAFDVGEYGMGMCANSLELGCDCLGLIRYFDAHLCDSRGEPLTIKNADLHARGGLRHPLEAHRPPPARQPEVRRSRRLVVSSISTVENYEYGFFWYLYQDGTIQFEIKLTGILSLGAFPPGETPQYGVLVAPAALRTQSSALLQRAARLRPRRHRQHRLPGRRRARPDRRAQPVRERLPGQGDAAEDRESRRAGTSTWRRRGPGRSSTRTCRTRSASRSATSFLPGDNSFPLRLAERLVAEAGRVRQPSRLGHARISADEKYGAGDYPNQSQGGDGLIAVDRAGPPDREHRRRALVHLRPHAHPAAGGLPGDADGLHRLHAQAATASSPPTRPTTCRRRRRNQASCCH